MFPFTCVYFNHHERANQIRIEKFVEVEIADWECRSLCQIGTRFTVSWNLLHSFLKMGFAMKPQKTNWPIYDRYHYIENVKYMSFFLWKLFWYCILDFSTNPIFVLAELGALVLFFLKAFVWTQCAFLIGTNKRWNCKLLFSVHST